MEHFFAKKSLGQNFIHAPHVIAKMVHEATAQNSDFILEIGPGKGALTRALLDKGARVLAVEKDERSVEFIKEKFAKEISEGQLVLVSKDILEFDTKKDFAVIGDQVNTNKSTRKYNYVICSNIPYYITGKFLKKFLEDEENKPEKIVVMLQKEVAKRIVGEQDPKKKKKENILSISVKAFGKPKYIVTVSRKFFRPVPNVDSAVLLIDSISNNFFEKIDKNWFFELVKTGFSHKRKVLIKNLEEIVKKEQVEALWTRENWSKNIRAEDISLEDWRKISFSTEKA